AGWAELQLEGNRAQDFIGRDAGVGDIDRFDVRWQPRLQHVAQHGLAAAHFAGYLYDALAVNDGVDQRFQNRPAIAAAEEKLGIGGDLERRLVQAEMDVVHEHLLRLRASAPKCKGRIKMDNTAPDVMYCA